MFGTPVMSPAIAMALVSVLAGLDQPRRSDNKGASSQGIRVPVKPRGTVGRNDPCPCGSGKKHKKCCR